MKDKGWKLKREKIMKNLEKGREVMLRKERKKEDIIKIKKEKSKD